MIELMIRLWYSSMAIMIEFYDADYGTVQSYHDRADSADNGTVH